jgi:sugar phosphate isomerase/epimerase
MRRVNMKNVGTLPDFGNFYEYDRYQGVEDLMPFAKGVSAKSNDFGPDGNELNMDYYRLLGIVKQAGYRGRIGIEYEGNRLSEHHGILKTKAILEEVLRA